MRAVILLAGICAMTSAWSQTTHFESTVNINEFKGKVADSSPFCFMSNSSSETSTSQNSVSSNEKTGRIVQEFNKWGKQVHAREIKWDSSSNEDSFQLSFYADHSYFQTERTYDEKACSYKIKKAETSHATTRFNSSADIVLPENTWLVRARFPKFQDKGSTDILLSNWDYATDETGKKILVKRPLRMFTSAPGTTYFLVNPSTKDIQNAVNVDVTHVNNTIGADKFILDLKIDRIGVVDCLKELGTRSYKDILWSSAQAQDAESAENALVNLGCMMTPNYIRHIFKNMFITSVTDFFSEIDKLETFLMQIEGDKASQYQGMILDLIRKIKFYYSYEMAKDIMLLVQGNAHSGNVITNLHAVEELRTAGSKQLLLIARTFYGLVDTVVKTDAYSMEIDKKQKINWSILDTLMSVEMSFIKGHHDAIVKPNLLSTQYYNDLESSINELERVSQEVKKLTVEIKTRKITRPYLNNLKQLLGNYINAVENYSLAWQSFNGNFFNGSTGEEIVASHREFYLNFRTIFEMNTVILGKYFQENSAYFHENFEANEFKTLTVNGEKFETAEDFIKRFHEIMGGAL